MNISVHTTLSHKLFLIATEIVLVFSLACTPVSFSFSPYIVDAKVVQKNTKTINKKTAIKKAAKKKSTVHISAGTAAQMQVTKTAKAVSIAAAKNKKVAVPTSDTTGLYTMTQVAAANTETTCWTVIDGTVYDLTKWINKHPGGQENIVSICGIDGTQAFNSQHAGQGRPERILATYKIGALQDVSQ